MAGKTRSTISTKGAAAEPAASNERINRRPFVAELLKQRGEGLVISGLGSPTWDVFAAGDRADNLYLWGGMGLAVPGALGLALAQPKRRVLCVTGDGEMMMGIGSLAVVGAEAPSNLAILVLDNESFAETGRQGGLTAKRTDLIALAQGFGIAKTRMALAPGDARSLGEFLFKEEGPLFAVAKIAITEDPWRLPEKDGAVIARRFRVSLGLERA